MHNNTTTNITQDLQLAHLSLSSLNLLCSSAPFPPAAAACSCNSNINANMQNLPHPVLYISVLIMFSLQQEENGRIKSVLIEY